MVKGRVWVYYGNVIRIHDGDTFAVDLDLGCFLWRKDINVRIAGINAPELSEPSGSGKAALTFLESLISVGDEVRLESLDGKFYEKYGRLLAKPYTTKDPVPMDIAAVMISTGHAVPDPPA